MTNLITALDLAQEACEKRIAAEINAPKQKLDDTEALLILRQFAEWCQARGVKWLPATPATVAGFIRFQHANRIAPGIITRLLDAIQVAHDNSNFASPVYTAAVGQELTRILEVKKTPRWPKAELPLFYSLPSGVQAIIARRDEQQSNALRRLQTKVDIHLKKEGNLQCQPENKSTEASTASNQTTPSS
jgi:hypothetical protein